MVRALLLQEFQARPQGVRLRHQPRRCPLPRRCGRHDLRRRLRLRPQGREPQPPLRHRALRRSGHRYRRNRQGRHLHGCPAHRTGRPPLLRIPRPQGRDAPGYQAPPLPDERSGLRNQGLRKPYRNPHHHRRILLRRELHRQLPGQRVLSRNRQAQGPAQQLRIRPRRTCSTTLHPLPGRS